MSDTTPSVTAVASARGPDCLLLSIGDYSLDRKNGLPSDFAAQNVGLPWGKIVRLNLTDSKTSIYSLGHRNPGGLTRLDDGTIVESNTGRVAATSSIS